jgi:hypothetical protein
MRSLIIILSLVSTIFATSCSAPKRAQWHYKKALKNGLQLVQDSDTIRITTVDSIPVIHNDTIVWEKFYTTKDTIVFFKNIIIPKTRWQTRIEYRYKTKVEKIRGNTITKKHEVPKYRLAWWPFWLGLAIPYILRLAWNAILSKLNR